MGNLIFRNYKSIAESAFHRWATENGFANKNFTLEVTGNEAIIKDEIGNTLNLTYDNVEKCVKVDE